MFFLSLSFQARRRCRGITNDSHTLNWLPSKWTMDPSTSHGNIHSSFPHRATTIHVLLFASFGYCTPKFAYLFFYLLNFLVTARTACSTDAWWQCWYGYLITLGWTYFKPYRLFYCTVYLFLLSRINAVKMKEENT